MSKLSQIKNTLAVHRHVEEEIRKELISLIDDQFEDLRGAQVLSRGPYAITVNAKYAATHDTWDPEFYSLPLQWQRIQNILRSNDGLDKQIKRLERIAETGKYVTTDHGMKVTYKFHPDVQRRLRLMLETAA